MGVFQGIIVLYISSIALSEIITPEYLEELRASKNDEEFARLMGIEDVSLVRADENLEDPTLISVSELGDILLTQEQLEQARQGLLFSKYPTSKWPNRQIPYVISTSDFTSSQRSRIESALSRLNNQLSNLKVVQRSSQSDYVIVISGNGCYSNLGKIGGRQTISLQSNGCLSIGTIQHEFLHAAGFTHEHNRSDRDSFVKVLFENIPQEWRSQYQKVSSNDFGNQANYDYYSVMHYGMKAPGTSKDAFQILKSGIDRNRIGQRNGVSSTDVQKTDRLYA